ncbi:MAG: fumarylacetoacetate hydrolase family protein [Caldilinea sp.]|nr:fumarylacetoacetate hydrolase family protein [Caldilinea sp.]MDW8441095.1 fumarylacetoacetate hydrolase family protein [Caldilineaceae bacterium]
MNLNAAEQTLADAIANARRNRIAMPGRTREWNVDIAGAYRIQRHLQAQTDCVGYKLGLVGPAKQVQMGLQQPIYGQIRRSMLLEGEVRLSDFIQPQLEPEIAVVLRKALPAEAEPGMAAHAVGGYFLGVDVLDSVWTDYRFSAAEVIADNASGGAFLLSNRLLEAPPVGSLRLYLNGILRSEGPVEALGNVEEQLCRLARAVGGLEAGHIVFLGSPAEAIPVETGVLEVRSADHHLLLAKLE